MSAAAKKVGLLQLTFMIYGAVCGGAFGVETMVSGSGPGIAIVVLALMPFVFSIPISLAVAELTTAFPVEGGNYRWSRLAFGDFAGFQAAWWAWMTGMVTNSTFAVLFATYLQGWIPDMAPWAKLAAALAVTWAVFLLNVLGIDVVGTSAIVLSILVLLPFVGLTALGCAGWAHNPMVPFARPDLGLLAALAPAMFTGIWLYSGYDKLSSVAEEVEQPQRVFPPALLGAATLAMLSYLLPTVASLVSYHHWDKWTDGYFNDLAAAIGGPYLKHAMVFAGLCSNALLLNVTQLAASRVPLAVAQDGLVPRWIGWLAPGFNTPVVTLALGSLVTSVFAWRFTYEQLLVIYAWFQMASNLLVYVNVHRMRQLDPGTARPFSVPGGTAGLVALALPSVLIAVFAAVTPIWKDGKLVQDELIKGTLAFASGPVLYALFRPFSSRSPAPDS